MKKNILKWIGLGLLSSMFSAGATLITFSLIRDYYFVPNKSKIKENEKEKTSRKIIIENISAEKINEDIILIIEGSNLLEINEEDIEIEKINEINNSIIKMNIKKVEKDLDNQIKILMPSDQFVLEEEKYNVSIKNVGRFSFSIISNLETISEIEDSIIEEENEEEKSPTFENAILSKNLKNKAKLIINGNNLEKIESNNIIVKNKDLIIGDWKIIESSANKIILSLEDNKNLIKDNEEYEVSIKDYETKTLTNAIVKKQKSLPLLKNVRIFKDENSNVTITIGGNNIISNIDVEKINEEIKIEKIGKEIVSIGGWDATFNTNNQLVLRKHDSNDEMKISSIYQISLTNFENAKIRTFFGMQDPKFKEIITSRIEGEIYIDLVGSYLEQIKDNQENLTIIIRNEITKNNIILNQKNWNIISSKFNRLKFKIDNGAIDNLDDKLYIRIIYIKNGKLFNIETQLDKKINKKTNKEKKWKIPIFWKFL